MAPKSTKVTEARTRRRYTRAAETKKPLRCITDVLPTDILIAEVVARVAASSIVDLCSCKLTCKVFDGIGEDKHVLKQVSLEGLPLFIWLRADEAKSFIKRCQESYNAEALFQLGTVQYFSQMKLEEGIRSLEKAAEQGHKAAAYVLGIIFLCNGEDEYKKTGILLIMEVIKARGIVDCRKKLREIMSSIWMKNHLILQNRPVFLCTEKEQHEIQWRGWGQEDYYDEDCEEGVLCETCRCNREISFFYKLLQVHAAQGY